MTCQPGDHQHTDCDEDNCSVAYTEKYGDTPRRSVNLDVD
jgi:hypothetical protein